MATLKLVSIMTLMLIASSGSARAATLIVSNQMQTRSNVPVFVTCQGATPNLSKPVPLGQVSMIEIEPTAGRNATDDKAAGSRVSPWTSCVGTFQGAAHFWPSEMMYSLYNSDKHSTKCKSVCFVVARDDGFYRWNNEKNAWDMIPPTIWF